MTKGFSAIKPQSLAMSMASANPRFELEVSYQRSAISPIFWRLATCLRNNAVADVEILIGLSNRWRHCRRLLQSVIMSLDRMTDPWVLMYHLASHRPPEGLCSSTNGLFITAALSASGRADSTLCRSAR